MGPAFKSDAPSGFERERRADQAVNRNSLMTSIAAMPPSSAARPAARRWLLAAIPLAILAVAGLGYWAFSAFVAGRNTGAAYRYHVVAAGEFIVKVQKDGELQAVTNDEVMSQVEGLTTIIKIVEEGKPVTTGEELVVLDSSDITLKIDDVSLLLKRAQADTAAAVNAVEIMKSQNQANEDAAAIEVDLAKLSVEEYELGTFKNELETAKTALKMAKITLANKEDDLKQTRALYAKQFVNLADVKNAELAVETVRNDMTKADMALFVLEKYTYPMIHKERESVASQAVQKQKRTEFENQTNLNKTLTALSTAQAAEEILTRRLARLQEQKAACTITAKTGGIVVYSQPGRGDGQPIQAGTQVRERQVILRLPDTSSMKAVVRINENQVIRLMHGQRGTVRITGVRDPIDATVQRISPVADSSTRWMNPDTREYPVELKLDWTPPNLKPGISVQAEIVVEREENAISVPLTAIYSAGADHYVFVRDAGSNPPKPRKVTIGSSNDSFVRIVSDLAVNEEVVLLQAGQGRELLEKAGITPTPEVTKPREPKTIEKDVKDLEPRMTPGKSNVDRTEGGAAGDREGDGAAPAKSGESHPKKGSRNGAGPPRDNGTSNGTPNGARKPAPEPTAKPA